MRITKDTPPIRKTKQKIGLKWQIEDYAQVQELRFHFPYSFLLICKLWNTTPDEMLTDFMDNLSCGSWKRENRDAAKTNLKNYAIEMNYGRQHYTKDDLQQMFTELDAIGMLWPENAKPKIQTLHVKWRKKYYNWWFKKWFKKYHRKPNAQI